MNIKKRIPKTYIGLKVRTQISGNFYPTATTEWCNALGITEESWDHIGDNERCTITGEIISEDKHIVCARTKDRLLVCDATDLIYDDQSVISYNDCDDYAYTILNKIAAFIQEQANDLPGYIRKGIMNDVIFSLNDYSDRADYADFMQNFNYETEQITNLK